jgi:hypothetical protein
MATLGDDAVLDFATLGDPCVGSCRWFWNMSAMVCMALSQSCSTCANGVDGYGF